MTSTFRSGAGVRGASGEVTHGVALVISKVSAEAGSPVLIIPLLSAPNPAHTQAALR